MALHTTGSQSTTKLIEVQVAMLKLHISHVQSWSNTTTSNHRTDQMADAAKMMDQCRNLLDRLYYYLKPVGGGRAKAKVHMTWKNDGALIWLGQLVESQPLTHWLSLPSTSKLVDIQVSRQRLSFTGAYWGNPTPQAAIVRYISQPVDAPKVSVEPRPLFDIISQATGTLPIRRFSSNGCVRDQILQLTTTSIGGIKPDGLLKHWNHEHIHVPQFSPTTDSLTFPALDLQACWHSGQ